MGMKGLEQLFNNIICKNLQCHFFFFFFLKFVLGAFEFGAAKLHTPLKMFEQIMMKRVAFGHNKVEQGLLKLIKEVFSIRHLGVRVAV